MFAIVNLPPVYCYSCNVSVPGHFWSNHRRLPGHLFNAMRRRELRDNSLKIDDPAAQLPVFRLPGKCTFDKQIQLFLNQVYFDPKAREDIQTKIVTDLTPNLERAFENVQVQFYGSMVTGLAFLGSDVDLRVKVDSFNDKTVPLIWDHLEKSRVYRCTDQLFSDQKFANVVPIYDARTPIVRMVHAPTRAKVDISFARPFGVANSQMIRRYLHLNRRLFDVMLIIKYWSKTNAICNGQCSISSYGWTLLFIAFLQTLRLPNGKRLVPTVHEVQEQACANEKLHVRGFRVDFNPRNDSVVMPDDPSFSPLKLLEGFFKYYLDFPFGRKVVSPYSGEPIDCEQNIPPASSDLLSLARKRCCTSIKTIRRHFVATIQDPLKQNYLFSSSKKSLIRVKQCLATAAQVCEDQLKNERGESLLLEELFFGNVDQNGNPRKASPSTDTLVPMAIPTYSFLIHLNENPRVLPDQVVDFAVLKIRDIFEKIMTFFVTTTEIVTSDSGFAARRFKCAPVVPPAWQYLGKKDMNDHIFQIPLMCEQDLIRCFAAKMRQKGIRFRFLRTKWDRQFYCEVSLKRACELELKFEPCTDTAVGFVRHTSNYLRTSLGPWLNSLR